MTTLDCIYIVQYDIVKLAILKEKYLITGNIIDDMGWGYDSCIPTSHYCENTTPSLKSSADLCKGFKSSRY